MTERFVALLRGVNVGSAKRVAMADLRALLTDLGYADVRTLLNSGNVVFAAGSLQTKDIAAAIEQGLVDRLGVDVRVTVLRAAELADIVRGNPLLELAVDPSRLQVAFPATRADLARLEPLAAQDWSPEAFALGSGSAFLWCPDGVIASRLAKAVDRLMGDAVTSRNWATVLKLQALASE